jgi:hypothetical protein
MKNYGNKIPWWFYLSPMSQKKEVNYSLPFLIATKAFVAGDANEDNIAEIAGHLKIATYLNVEPEAIDEAKRIIFRIIRNWKNDPSYTDEEAEIVNYAMHEYAKAVSNSPLFLVQKATRLASGEPKKKKNKRKK